MARNPFRKLTAPRLPAVAIGLETGSLTAVQLESGGRGTFRVRRAASLRLPDDVKLPGLSEEPSEDSARLTEFLQELLTAAGLLKFKRWSVTLPEGAARSIIVTFESRPSSRAEGEEMLRWKIERALGGAYDELRASRIKLADDTEGRPRYFVSGIRLSVLRKYESAFEDLGLRPGFVLPRHIAEAEWLKSGTAHGDSILFTCHSGGFTATVLRQKQPILIRTVLCDKGDCSDEVYRVFLFYRDRLASSSGDQSSALRRLMVTGDIIDPEELMGVIAEALGQHLAPVSADDLGLKLPADAPGINEMAAPAGAARLAWA